MNAPSKIAIRGTPIPIPTPTPALAPADNPVESFGDAELSELPPVEVVTTACTTVKSEVGGGKKSTVTDDGRPLSTRKNDWTAVGRTLNQAGVPVAKSDAIPAAAAVGFVKALL